MGADWDGQPRISVPTDRCEPMKDNTVKKGMVLWKCKIAPIRVGVTRKGRYACTTKAHNEIGKIEGR